MFTTKLSLSRFHICKIQNMTEMNIVSIKFQFCKFFCCFSLLLLFYSISLNGTLFLKIFFLKLKRLNVLKELSIENLINFKCERFFLSIIQINKITKRLKFKCLQINCNIFWNNPNYALIFWLLIDVTHSAVCSTVYKNKTRMILNVYFLENFYADVAKKPC